ncbi:MAG: tetratricopeptide repeat protein [Casimicrobiaceae bacterium]
MTSSQTLVSMAEAMQRATAFHQANRLAEAEHIYNAIIAARPDHDEALRLLGLVEAQRGRFAQADQLLERAIASNPQSILALGARAQVQKGLGRFDEALANCDRAMALTQDVTELLNLRGAIAVDAQRYDEALANLDGVLARDATHAEAQYNRAVALQAMGREDDALAGYERTIAVHPDFPEALHNRAGILKSRGRVDEALASWDRALAAKPELVQALNNRGALLRELKRPVEALSSVEQALTLAPEFAEAWSNRGGALNDLMRHEEALASCDRAVALKPGLADAHLNRAAALAMLLRNDEALASCDRAVALTPESADALQARGRILAALERYDEALTSFDRALVLRPGFALGLRNRGLVLLMLQRYNEALANLDAALAIEPDYFDALQTRGSVLKEQDRMEDALASWEKAAAVRPDAWEPHYLRGSALVKLKRFDAAIAAYDRALVLKPDFIGALEGRGTALAALHRYEDAVRSFDAALAINSTYVDAHHNRGSALSALGRYDEAEASYGRALEFKHDFIESRRNRGSVLMILGRHQEASEEFARVLAIDADRPFAQVMLLLSRLHACDWRDYEEAAARLLADVEGAKAGEVEPFAFLLICDSARAQRRCAEAWVTRHCPPMPPLWNGERYAHDRIRVAYLSADFHEHATAYLMAELFERHDRGRFETYALSLGPDDGSAMRARLEGAFEHFIDVRHQRDEQVAQRLRELEIDIVVDLKGFTHEGRTEILAWRSAPIQVNYLGYPGTLGSPYHDYIIADDFVIPPGARENYTEQVAYLPGSYQVNDRKRPIAPRTPLRSEAGLPEHGFVFCSFNNNYKITPAMFDVWMRLLQQVEGSVLWLLEGNAAAPPNLRREAAARGIAPERLVFAPRLPLDEHLARHRLADLFLDTLPCNAHTTGSDALWAGLPMLTCAGGAFAGRVAGSLLRAVGLPELVTGSLAEYEALALRLARDPEQLAALKATLGRNRDTCALFDSARSTLHLESAYVAMVERYRSGEPPAGFAVAAM